ncbi:unnamed protein product, partial [Ixodes pacificus]
AQRTPWVLLNLLLLFLLFFFFVALARYQLFRALLCLCFSNFPRSRNISKAGHWRWATSGAPRSPNEAPKLNAISPFLYVPLLFALVSGCVSTYIPNRIQREQSLVLLQPEVET